MLRYPIVSSLAVRLNLWRWKRISFTSDMVEEWERLLSRHPVREYGNYLLRGMKEGFRIGFHYVDCAVKTSWV